MVTAQVLEELSSELLELRMESEKNKNKQTTKTKMQMRILPHSHKLYIQSHLDEFSIGGN